MSALVGRDRDLAVLLSLLEEAEHGRARLVVCVGEAGIGKTRLADELSRTARSRGAVVAWGRAATTEGAAPYRPWIEVVRELAAAGCGDSQAVAGVLAMTGEPSVAERMRWFDAVTGVV